MTDVRAAHRSTPLPPPTNTSLRWWSLRPDGASAPSPGEDLHPASGL